MTRTLSLPHHGEHSLDSLMTYDPSSYRERPESLRNISRVDSGTIHGWLVRYQRKGKKSSRFFNDTKHGGPDDALLTAQSWRDERLKEVGPTPKSDASAMQTKASRRRNRQAVSRTGVTGIGFVVREFANQRVPYVTAYWLDEDGKRHQTSFSIQKHGVERAVRLAAKARAGTADWHGARRVGRRKLYNEAIDRIRELAEPYPATLSSE